MTIFKLCTFILFYFIVRLAFTPDSGSVANNYDTETNRVTTAQIASLTH